MRAPRPLPTLRRIALATTISSAALAVLAGNAQAAAPPCTPEELAEASSPVRNVETATIPFERKATETLYVGYHEDGTTVVLRALSGKPLAKPYAKTFARQDDGDIDVPIELSKTDGPAVLDVTATVYTGNFERDSSGSCRGTFTSRTITPVPGKVTRSGAPTIDRDEATVDVPLNTQRCSGAETLTVEVRYLGRTKRIRGKGCAIPNGTRARGNLRIRSDYDGPDDETVNLTFFNASNAVSSRSLTYRVKYAGKTVTTGSFTFVTKYYRGKKARRIYDSDFDNYVNICINKNYTTRASGGRLYCTVPGEKPYYYTLIRNLKST